MVIRLPVHSPAFLYTHSSFHTSTCLPYTQQPSYRLICLLYTHLPSYKLTCFAIHSCTFLHTHLPSHMIMCLPIYSCAFPQASLSPIHSPAHLPSYTLICLPIQSPTFLYVHMLSYTLTSFPTHSSASLYSHLPSCMATCLPIHSSTFLYTHLLSHTVLLSYAQRLLVSSPELEQCLHRHAGGQACTTHTICNPTEQHQKMKLNGKILSSPAGFPPHGFAVTHSTHPVPPHRDKGPKLHPSAARKEKGSLSCEECVGAGIA